MQPYLRVIFIETKFLFPMLNSITDYLRHIFSKNPHALFKAIDINSITLVPNVKSY